MLREIGDRVTLALTLTNLGITIGNQGDYSAARAHSEEGLAISREIGFRKGVDIALYNFGSVSEKLGKYVEAQAYFRQSLVISRGLGDRRSAAEHLESFASLSLKQGKPGDAVMLWGAAGALRAKIGAPLSPIGREQYDQGVAAARRGLGEEAFAAAWVMGQAMTLDEATDLALQSS